MGSARDWALAALRHLWLTVVGLFSKQPKKDDDVDEWRDGQW